jgi:uncharacterized membrane protein YdjX (TVP38/TMEM64 family)
MKAKSRIITVLIVLLILTWIVESFRGGSGPSETEILFFAQLKEWRLNLPEPGLLPCLLFLMGLSVCTNLALPVLPVFGLLGPAWLGLPLSWALCTLGLTAGTWLPFFLTRKVKLERLKEKANQWIPGAWQTLLAFRLSPLVPVSLVSAGAGLMPPERLPISKYFAITAIGIQPLLWCYLIAGQNLAKVESFRDIVDIRLIAALTVLGIISYFATYSISLKRQKIS